MSVHDRRVVDAGFTITGPAETNGFVNALPMLHSRYFPSIEEGSPPSMDELVTMKSYDWEGSDVWTGDATLSFGAVAGGGAREPRAGRDDRRLLAQRRRDVGHRHEARLTRVARAPRTIDRSTARRLAVAVQRLSGTPPRSSPRAVLGVIRSIRCVQLDPIAVVARSPHLVLGSRVAGFDPKHLDRLLWRDRSVYEYWAHAASIVLAEDHPIHAWYMRQYLRDDGSGWNRRRLSWMAANAKLKRSVMTQIRREGPVLARRISGGMTGSRGARAAGRTSATWTGCSGSCGRRARSWSPAARASRSSGT